MGSKRYTVGGKRHMKPEEQEGGDRGSKSNRKHVTRDAREQEGDDTGNKETENYMGSKRNKRDKT